MKNILLYGDSFFWGVDTLTGGRHTFSDRIGNLCQQQLGEGYDVITEGLRGRTMFGENGWFPERDGLDQFGPIFASHLPLDLVVIMLGTNDLNTKTLHSPTEIAKALDGYVLKMKFWCDFMKYSVPKIIVVSPPQINEAELTAFKDIFDASANKIPELCRCLKDYALEKEYGFINAADIVVSKNTDGIHIDASENKKLADVFVTEFKNILKDPK